MTTPVAEPDFEGEEMKLPEEIRAVEPAVEPTSIVNGPILILLFAILIALLGGIYYWYTILMSTPLIAPAPSRPTAEQNNEPESATAEARTGVTDVVSTSDALDAIKADVDSTNFEDPATDFAAVETELGGDIKAQRAPEPEPTVTPLAPSPLPNSTTSTTTAP